ncbi:hypothetical protein HDU67_004033 [Dinochytrium kinnereticum]|nr:hypothetical protein HDU67_004033 [Dinochytrium kinnereticum]
MPVNWLGSRSNLELPDAEVDIENEGSNIDRDGVKHGKLQAGGAANVSSGTLDLKMLDSGGGKKGPSPMRRIYVNIDPKDDPSNSFHPKRRASKFRSPTLDTFKRLSTVKQQQSTRSLPQGSATLNAETQSPTVKRPPSKSPEKMKQVMASTHASVCGFPSNKVRTSKYTIWTFIPKNLFEQFRSVANFYFTSLVILQIFPPFSQVSIVLTAAPIVFIIAVTAFKDGLEDMKRHKSDRSVNKSKTYLLTQPWMNVNFAPNGGGVLHLASLGTLPAEKNETYAGTLPPPSPSSRCGRNSQNIMDWLWPPPLLLNHPNFIGPAEEVVPDSPPTKDSDESDTPPSPYGLNIIGGSEALLYGKKSLWKLSDWENVGVGDFVFLRDNDPIPADMIIISTSEPDCVCYVETKNLDGETNLKVRRGITDLSYVKSPEDCTRLRCYVDSEPPNANLYSYSGVLSIRYSDNSPHSVAPSTKQSVATRRRSSVVTRDSFNPTVTIARRKGSSSDEENEGSDEVYRQVPVGPNGILLRGCVLRNTGWVIGIAVYTGGESKIMLNSGNTPSKRSRIDRQLNPLVMVNFLLLIGMCLVCGLISAVYAGTFIGEKAPFAWADGDSYSPAYAAFVTFFSCMIIFQAIIPIALYISVDISKTVQSIFISTDPEMYDKALDKHATPQAWNLCDDLGQIEYIFSDKTGTLTCNMMEFRRCSINGVLYGANFISEATQGAAEREGKTIDKEAAEATRRASEAEMRKAMAELFDTKYIGEKLSFIDPLIPKHLMENCEQGRRIREFFTLLCVCHTVLVEKQKREGKHAEHEASEEGSFTEKIEYKAQSPDEAALVAAARDVGFAFLKRRDNVVDVDLLGESRSYTILNVLEFNSDRKRMSVIIRRPEGQLVLLVKGADSVVFERLKRTGTPTSPQSAPADGNSDAQHPLLDGADPDVTSKHLEIFANEGLRTLCLAYKVIPENVYEEWNKKFMLAQASIKDRDLKVDAVSELIETDLTLMGATAIEDKLQDGVPETIGTLAKAGIKIWVLTGDKMETAINISFSCNLLKRSMILIVIKSTSFIETYQQLLEALERFWTPDGQIRQGKSHALVIDGASLKFALHKNCRPLLLELGCRCKAVGAMCLAIGDGANDVSMIQEADVGIGIIGKEGLQAVMASDYAIGQFRFLGKLLLVHGRWGYIRTSEMILNYFYKNIVWLFVLFWFQFDCGFSASIITDFTYGMFFNTFFTLLPTMIAGIFDQDVNDRISMQVPQLYQRGIKQSLFTMERFWLYCMDAIYQSLVIYFFALLGSSGGSLDAQGYDHYMDSIGTSIAFAAIITVNFYNGINTSYWPWITFFGIIGSLIIWTIYVITYANSIDNPTYGQVGVTLKQPLFYAYVVIAIFVSLFPRLLIKYIQQYFFPSDIDIIAEVQKYSWKEDVVVETDLEDRGQTSTLGVNSETTSTIMSGESLAEYQNGANDIKRVRSDMAVNVEAAKRLSTGSQPSLLKRSNSERNVASLSSETPSLAERSSPRKAGSDPDAKKKSEVTTPDGFIPPISSLERRFSIEVERPDLSKLQKQRRGTGIGAVRPDLHLLKKAGEILKTPIKLKKPSSPTSQTSPVIRSTTRRPTSMSLVFMGTHEELPNLGFCFSHEGGMADVITPCTKIPLMTPATQGFEPEPEASSSYDGGAPTLQVRRRSRSTPASQRVSVHESIHEESHKQDSLAPPSPLPMEYSAILGVKPDLNNIIE